MDQRAAILVGIDFSDGAAAALLEARRLAGRLGATLEVLYVVESSTWKRDPDVAAWLKLQDVSLAGLATRIGTPWVQVVRHAEEISASLIVVGSHGRSGVHLLRPGSTAMRLLLRSPIPVLVATAQQIIDRRPGLVPASHQSDEP